MAEARIAVVEGHRAEAVAKAPEFYERLGYRKFGELTGVPKGARRISYAKALGGGDGP